MKKFVLSFLLIVLASACKKQTEEQKIESYKVISPIIIDTVHYKEYVANIEASLKIEIRTKIRGFIETVHVDEGQEVKKGQLLFTINNNGYHLDWQRAKAFAQSAFSEMQLAEIEMKNTEDLYKKQVVSETEFKIAQARYGVLKAKYSEAKAEEEKALLQVSYTQIKAHFDGFINRLLYKKGSFIDQGELLTTLTNTDRMYVYFSLSEKEYLDYFKDFKDNKQDELSLVLANQTDYQYLGVVETTDSEFNQKTGTIAFRATFENPENILKHGSTGKIRIKKILKDAMIIPQKSTFDVQEYTYVFLIDSNNTIISKRITPLLRIPNLYVIEPDISTKDKIVFEGIQMIKQGQKINPVVYKLKDLLNNQDNLR